MQTNLPRKDTKYIVIEGVEGVGKTTQCALLVKFLRVKGFSVLDTREPGSSHLPLTMTLRGLMLDAAYEPEMTKEAREYISQACRSIHLQKLIMPALGKYDFIIQDRGVLSGLAYGSACGLSDNFLQDLMFATIAPTLRKAESLYDATIILKGDVEKDLARAISSKKEFSKGDAMENRGVDFIKTAESNMEYFACIFQNVSIINTAKQSPEAVFDMILSRLQLDKF